MSVPTEEEDSMCIHVIIVIEVFYSFVLFFSPVSDGDSNKVLIEALTGDLKLYNCELRGKLLVCFVMTRFEMNTFL